MKQIVQKIELNCNRHGGIRICCSTGWHKKTGTSEKPNKNWRNPRKKIYWQKLNHYNLPF